METIWSTWKRGFQAWEAATARYMETVLRSPLVLTPSGAALSAFMRARAQANDRLAQSWGALGLPTKRDQERTLHALNQIQSRLLDLEEQLEDMEERLTPQPEAKPEPEPDTKPKTETKARPKPKADTTPKTDASAKRAGAAARKPARPKKA